MTNATVYVVSRSTGEYSDRSEIPIATFTTEADAKLFCTLAAEQYRTVSNLHPVPGWCDDDAEREEKLASRTISARKIATLDPDWIDEDGFEDPPYYYWRKTPLFTSLPASGPEGDAQ